MTEILRSAHGPTPLARPVHRAPVHLRCTLLACAVLALAVPGRLVAEVDGNGESVRPGEDPASAVDQLVERMSERDPALHAVVREVLARHPDLQAARARIDALDARPDQRRALPDPMARATLFPLPPETRVGPQRLSLGVEQSLPWLPTLELRARDAELAAEAARARLDARRLELVTTVRELWTELAFVATQRAILDEERGHLARHEEAARARYAAGSGLAQGPIKIQAELTRIDAHLLDVESRRRSLRARLDALRDRFEPPLPDVPPFTVAGARDVEAPVTAPVARLVARLEDDPGGLDRALAPALAVALERRPEARAAAVERRRAGLGVELAEASRKPSFTVGLAWTQVDPRRDAAGRANPPEGDGDDVLAITGGVRLPIWRRALDAQLAESTAQETAAHADERTVAVEIRRQLADLGARIPLEHQQLRLLRDVLERQAEEAVRSATSAYATGHANALDLLDAEHRLFEVRLAAARAHADLHLAVVRLEGALAAPIDDPIFTDHLFTTDTFTTDTFTTDADPSDRGRQETGHD